MAKKKVFDEWDLVPNLPGTAGVKGISDAFKTLFVVVAISVGWLALIAIATYYVISSGSGSFLEGLATNSLASLILLAAAPIIFRILPKSRWCVSLALGAAIFILALAALFTGASRDLLLNLGTGLWFLVAIDYYVSQRFQQWQEDLAQEREEQAKLPIMKPW